MKSVGMRYILSFTMVVLFSVLAGIPAAAAEAAESEELTVWVGTDIHYLDEELSGEDCPEFMRVIMNGDGKITDKTPEILAELEKQVIEAQPDALVLLGDLTFNGEMLSLEDLKAAFQRIEDAGVQVCVIPGNHDIFSFLSFGYRGEDEYYWTPNITDQQFRDEMYEFGPADALAVDENSFSYMTGLSDRVRILFLDANTQENPGVISEKTLAWAEEQLKIAKKDGAEVIAATHQNVLAQSELLYEGFVIENHADVQALIEKYGVRLCLSGHSHLQHTSTAESGLTDICTEAMSVYPLRYGVLTVSDRGTDEMPGSSPLLEWRYEMNHLPIEQEYSKAFLAENIYRQAGAQLEGLAIPAETRSRMLDFAVDVMIDDYTGSMTEEKSAEYRAMEEQDFWREYASDTFWYPYLLEELAD